MCYLNLKKKKKTNGRQEAVVEGKVVFVGRGLLEYSGSLSTPPPTSLARPALGWLFSPEDKLPQDRDPVFLWLLGWFSVWPVHRSDSLNKRNTFHLSWLISWRTGTQDHSPSFSKRIEVEKMRVPQSKVRGEKESRCVDPKAGGSHGN